ncbi:tumor necrosis factor receptor superfamily member 16 [Chanos chanos]|uniref:Tumor necrosis factor receptor superfamily member 16 n=1 Tax=Chanos chanos TaxID=29144 RepID=A0A6J2W6V6_CHACN|nr:tumor necrosis factor receptor superfamily member 16-like [Chanos chanos]
MGNVEHLARVVTGNDCASGRYTDAGECCKMCPVGSGMALDCGQENTRCQACQDGVTFSDSEGLSRCRPCGRCPRSIATLAVCTAERDTHCDCGEGFYLWRERNSTDGLCAPCTLCERGHGVVWPCGVRGDTQCQPCPPGTYSEKRSIAHTCQPCSRCQDNEVEIRACQPNSDTLCMEKDLQILSRPSGSDGPKELPHRPVLEEDEGGKTSPAPGSSNPRNNPHDVDQGGSNNLVVYVSVLAAVVLGLLLYVAYKCWKSCQQKQALGKARVGEVSTPAEGEKLHSDSGVFLDSHSLQDNQPSKGGKRDSKQDILYMNIPPHRQEEVEQALMEGGGRGWRQLAVALGYEQERVDVIGRGQDPVHTLLSDWALQEGATLGVLCAALARIERSDVAGVLTAPAQGVSVV